MFHFEDTPSESETRESDELTLLARPVGDKTDPESTDTEQRTERPEALLERLRKLM